MPKTESFGVLVSARDCRTLVARSEARESLPRPGVVGLVGALCALLKMALPVFGRKGAVSSAALGSSLMSGKVACARTGLALEKERECKLNSQPRLSDEANSLQGKDQHSVGFSRFLQGEEERERERVEGEMILQDRRKVAS